MRAMSGSPAVSMAVTAANTRSDSHLKCARTHEQARDANQPEGGRLAEVDLSLDESFEGGKAFRFVETSRLNFAKDRPDVEKRLGKVFAKRFDLREGRVKGADSLLEIFGVLWRSNRRSRTPRKRGLGRARSSFRGVLGGVPGSPRSGSAQAELAFRTRAGRFGPARFPSPTRRGLRGRACLAPLGWLRLSGFLRLGHIALGSGKIRRLGASLLATSPLGGARNVLGELGRSVSRQLPESVRARLYRKCAAHAGCLHVAWAQPWRS